jgi:hypothetical protein
MALGRILSLARLKYLFFFVLPLVACSGGDGGAAGETGAGGSPVVLSWTAPTERQDGTTPMALNEIAGYRVYYKQAAGRYNDQPPVYIDDSNNVASVQVRMADIPAQAGTYLMVVTTIDIDGRESAFSAPEVEVTF